MPVSLLPRLAVLGRCISRLTLVLAFLSSPLTALAGDEESSFTLQGFGTLGAARSTTKDVEFVRDLSQRRGIVDEWSPAIDSVLGVQGSWRINPQFEAVAQATGRAGSRGGFTPELTWAYVKYDPTPYLSLRAGRLGTEFFMLADSRWVGYSFLTVRPPGDYFWYLPFYGIHGGDAAVSANVGEGVVRGKVFYGLSRGKIPLASEDWKINGSPMMGAYLEYQIGGWHLRGSYANLRFEHDLPIAQVLPSPLTLSTAAANFLQTRGKRTHYYSLGVVYDQGPWQAQLMLNHIEQGTEALESSDGGYGLVGYRIASVTPYLGYSWVYSHERATPLGFDPVTTGVIRYVRQDSHTDQKTTFIGVRWDVVRNVALKAQWDAIRGASDSYFPYRKDHRATWDGKTNIFSLTLDFVF